MFSYVINLSWKVFRNKERDTPDFSIWPKPRAHPPQGHGELAKVNLLPTAKLNWLFLKFQPKLPVRDDIPIPRSHFLSGVSIVTSLNDTSAPCAREPLRSCLHLTNQCAKWKALSLTKPKGKIYKTKSLSHYITFLLLVPSYAVELWLGQLYKNSLRKIYYIYIYIYILRLKIAK